MSKKILVAFLVAAAVLTVWSIKSNRAQEGRRLGIQTSAKATDKVLRNIRYTEADDNARSLDIYQIESKTERSDGDSSKHPVMVWVHGGAWRIGDKKSVDQKPAFFNALGYVFVSVNYRMIDEVKPATMATDVAASIAYLKKNAEQFGIDASQIHLAGHSAGAHLVALISSDPSYLQQFKLGLGDIKSCVPIDTGCYDIAEHLREMTGRKKRLFTSVFTTDVEQQKKVSPYWNATDPKSTPPFLILHCESRQDAAKQSKAFAKKMNQAGAKVTVTGFQGKTHRTINRELGKDDDAPTAAIKSFLEKLKPAKKEQKPNGPSKGERRSP